MRSFVVAELQSFLLDSMFGIFFMLRNIFCSLHSNFLYCYHFCTITQFSHFWLHSFGSYHLFIRCLRLLGLPVIFMAVVACLAYVDSLKLVIINGHKFADICSCDVMIFH